ncbi:MAG TPA: SRPBCC domain-containing protein [Polyangiales bacterium]
MANQLVLVVRRTIAAEPSRVFEAWTRPEQLLEWWGPRPVRCTRAEVELRVGGGYRLENTLPDGSVVVIFGEFAVIEPPHRLSYSWFLQAAAAEPSEASRVTVRFEPHPRGTEVIVLHERIESKELRSDHERGWNGCLDGLSAFFA